MSSLSAKDGHRFPSIKWVDEYPLRALWIPNSEQELYFAFMTYDLLLLISVCGKMCNILMETLISDFSPRKVVVQWNVRVIAHLPATQLYFSIIANTR